MLHTFSHMSLIDDCFDVGRDDQSYDDCFDVARAPQIIPKVRGRGRIRQREEPTTAILISTGARTKCNEVLDIFQLFAKTTFYCILGSVALLAY